jgi:hypothetical protein
MSLRVAAGEFLYRVSGTIATAPGVCWMSFVACSILGTVKLTLDCEDAPVVVVAAVTGWVTRGAVTTRRTGRSLAGAGLLAARRVDSTVT